jgi:hypothetical protein
MPVANQILIRVGHPAYQGTNSVRLCFSKSQAVRVLRNRGIRRDSALEAIERALEVGGSSVNANILESIEVADMTHPLWNGYYSDDRKTLRDQWAGRSEQ